MNDRGWARAVLVASALLAAPLWAQSVTERAKARLPKLDGTFAVAGLDSAVEVRRDRFGVPHIYAKTQHDLFLAQGYVVAQDRLFQMEMWRRMGEGRLAEVLGPDAVGRDRIARLLKYRGDWNAEYSSYATDAKQILAAFADGVNAYIAQVRSAPPIEFDLLGIRPEPWTPEVPLQRMAALSMTGNALSELPRARLVASLGAARVDSLFPVDPPRRHDPVRGLDYSGIDATLFADFSAAQGGIAYPRVEGSNNWVVSGAKTSTGKPLLANDPHRTIQNPSLRYLTHLVGPGWNVIGAGEPGVPGVAAGHNEAIAFGFTIVGMDQQDVYVETVRSCPPVVERGATSAAGARCYLNHGTWKPVTVVADTIRVKDEPPRAVTLEFTEHGPLVAEDTAKKRAYALRFVGTEPGTAGYLASLTLDRAKNWTGFVDAAQRWRLPTENLIYADTAGNIGWVASGLMPIRSWSGLLPVPGDGRYEWQGFLDVKDLPQKYNPDSGIIVTANNNILPPGYARPLNYEWAAPWRANRIRSVLDSGSKFTVQDFQRLQHDEFSAAAAGLVPVLLAATERAGWGARQDVAMLKGWDFVMRSEQGAPAIYEAWVHAVQRRLLAMLVPPDLVKAAGSISEVETLADLIRKPGPDFGRRAEDSRDSLVLAALDEAVAAVSRDLGTDMARWKWGDLHLAPFRHSLVAAFDLEPARRGGDGSTVNATSSYVGFEQNAGASFREVIDLADWDNSWATSTPGQSAQPGSAHYGDLLELWRRYEYFPLAYSRARVERETAHVMQLVPGR